MAAHLPAPPGADDLAWVRIWTAMSALEQAALAVDARPQLREVPVVLAGGEVPLIWAIRSAVAVLALCDATMRTALQLRDARSKAADA